MGVIYAAVPLEEEFCEYLDELEIEYPNQKEASRNPCPTDVLSALNEFDSLSVESGFANNSWQASVQNNKNNDWMTIHIQECNAPDTQGSLVFENGDPEFLILILKALSKSLGAFGLTPDTDELPLVVNPDIEVHSAMKTWEHTMDFEDE